MPDYQNQKVWSAGTYEDKLYIKINMLRIESMTKFRNPQLSRSGNCSTIVDGIGFCVSICMNCVLFSTSYMNFSFFEIPLMRPIFLIFKLPGKGYLGVRWV